MLLATGRIEIGVLHDLVEHFTRCVAFDVDLDPDRLKAHFGRRLLQGTARAPGGRIANVAFHVDLDLAELDLLPGGHCGDAHGQTAAQAGQHDLARRRCRVLTEQVQRLVNHHRRVIADVAERPVLAFHQGADFVGAA